MHVSRLSLTNFRNYARLELDLPDGVVLLHGNNAQGKTNLLEALYFLATTRSPHAGQDIQLVNWSAMRQEEPVIVGRLVAEVAKPEGPVQLEMRLIVEPKNGRGGQPSLRREALINRRKVRLMDLLGQLRVVMFLPEDVELVTGPPSARRRYLNITLCQVDSDYCRALSRYNKVLEQRNALLRGMAEGRADARQANDVLPILTERLIGPGSQLLVRRASFIAGMGREAQSIYRQELIGDQEAVRLQYAPRWRTNGRDDSAALETDTAWLEDHAGDLDAVSARFGEMLAESRQADLARGATTIGPHRDDWSMLVNGRDLGQYGSRGQVRTAVMALKLAEMNWMKAETDDTPLLLLDEVIAELDMQRRQALLSYIGDQVESEATSQVLMTATDMGMFPPNFLRSTTNMTVEGGRISQDAAPTPPISDAETDLA